MAVPLRSAPFQYHAERLLLSLPLSAACWKHFSQPEQAQSNYIWSFFADICKGVKKSGATGWLTTMAYGQYRPIPEVEIPDNLLVMLALRGPWNEGGIPSCANRMTNFFRMEKETPQ
ncbi:MAG: hypothetical protein V8T87_13735 [Victivallales bacterium]